MRPDRSCFIPLFGELRIANVAAQTRIVSVARIRLDSWKSVRSFKGIFYNDISEFESDHLSQAVQSRSAMSRSQEFVRHSRFTMGGKWLARRAWGTESDTFGHYVAILVGKIDPG
jgi:hypothetical protein